MTQIVQMQGMNKYFGTLHVLKEIDLTVEAGEVVVVIGASGSGKSTLIRCVNGLEEFESGKLVVDGNELAPKSGNPKALAEIRKEVGMVFQQFNLFPHLTVKKNIMLAPRKVKDAPETVANATAERLLNRVGIGSQADKFPSQLSGGQQQRVAIARALAMEPRLMLFAREVADRVIYIHEGQIVEEGKPADVFDNPQNERTQAFLSRVLAH
jgi:glutamine transport system ATP-binding protein